MASQQASGRASRQQSNSRQVWCEPANLLNTGCHQQEKTWTLKWICVSPWKSNTLFMTFSKIKQVVHHYIAHTLPHVASSCFDHWTVNSTDNASWPDMQPLEPRQIIWRRWMWMASSMSCNNEKDKGTEAVGLQERDLEGNNYFETI